MTDATAAAVLAVKSNAPIDEDTQELMLHDIRTRLAHYDGGFFNAYVWDAGEEVLAYDDYSKVWMVECDLSGVIANFDDDLQADMTAAWL